MIDANLVYEKILLAIQDIVPTLRVDSLGEQLDSLHRIFLVEQLEREFAIQARDILFDREAWKSVDTLAGAIKQKLLEK